MTTPSLAFQIRGRGRHYPWPPCDTSSWPRNRWGSVNPEDIPAEITPLPSVTNVLSVMDKGPGLMYWAAEQAIRDAYEGGRGPTPDEAVDRYKGAFRKTRDERAEAGTRAHTIAERLADDLSLPADLSEEDEAYADAYLAFWSDHDPTGWETEVTVFSPPYAYAGTADLFCVIDGKRVCVDYKTRGSRPEQWKIDKYGLLYDSNRAQLAALSQAALWAESPGVEGSGVVGAPLVREAMGVVLFPDGTYETETVEDLDRWFEVFLGCVRVWNALKGWDA